MVTIIEVYCDVCSTPAPVAARIGGRGDGQAVRQLFPAYHRSLRFYHGWKRVGGVDLCPDCVPKTMASEVAVEEENHELWQKISHLEVPE